MEGSAQYRLERAVRAYIRGGSTSTTGDALAHAAIDVLSVRGFIPEEFAAWQAKRAVGGS